MIGFDRDVTSIPDRRRGPRRDLALALRSACGIKGPLKLPPPPACRAGAAPRQPATEAASPDPAKPARKSREPFRYLDGELHAERVPLAAIAARFGTPCYVYSRAALESASARFDRAFAGCRISSATR